MGTPGSEPDVASYEYTFSLLSTCEEEFMAMYDLNDDETLSAMDILAWAAGPVDLDGDNDADAQDLDIEMDVVNEFGE